jgi:histidinol dehydrogenase
MTAGAVGRGAKGETAPVGLRFRGRLDALTDADRRALFERATSSDESVRRKTADVIARVRREGDEALFALAEQLDGV